jgi:levanbiose-producing levanase
MEYFAGTFDGFTFTANELGARLLSHGPDDYAAVTFSGTPGGRRILLGWLNHWGYFSHTGQMTLPRELHWREGELVQTPPPCVEKELAQQCVKIEVPEGSAPPVTIAKSPWELVLPSSLHSWCVEARIGDGLVFSLRRDTKREVWSLKREAASFPSSWRTQKEGLESAFTAPCEAPTSPDANHTTRIIVDAFSVEVFCDGGRAFFSAQIFPPEGEWQIEVTKASPS